MQRSADRVRDEQREREEAARTRKLALLSSSERAVADAVFKESVPLPEGTPIIRGYAWPPRESPGAAPPPVDYERLLAAMATTGFQASAFGAAVEEVNRMLTWRLSDEPLPAGEEPLSEAEQDARRNTRCKARVSLEEHA